MFDEPIHPFADRHEAGAELAIRLRQYAGRTDVVVLALPRGGVPVAFEVAQALDVPLDVFVVRKLGLPGHRELAFGAIASGGVRVLNDDVVRGFDVSDDLIDAVAREEQTELTRREREYRAGRRQIDLGGKVVILVDDGLATGATMRAAVKAVRQLAPSRVVVAVPVGSASTCAEFEDLADETVCARMPSSFAAVGDWYRDFSQTTDAEVRALLDRRAADVRDGRLP
jgi:putative phosphoribosyl transferase